MTIPSNLYAEKIYAEHPLATWHFDDEAYYISFLTNNRRNFIGAHGWTASANLSIKNPETDGDIDLISPLPFDFDDAGLSYCRITNATNIQTATSSNLVKFSHLNQDLETFTIGCWVYTTSEYLNSISIGYTYDAGTPVYNDFVTSVKDKWFFISGTFDIPAGVDNDDYIKIIVKINAENTSIDEMDYEFYFQGFTLGQLCEEYHAESLGKEVINPIETPASSAIYLYNGDNINLTLDGVVPVDAYGLSGNNGYYVVESNSLVAKDGAIPLVYGSGNSIKLIPHEEIITTREWSGLTDEDWQYWEDNGTWNNVLNLTEIEQVANAKPSIIFPGYGFLNEIGRNQEYTVEFWVNIDSNAKIPRRIFGPIKSTDGLFVDNGFLTLKIGTNFVSHYVGEWFRPMLVHIKLIKDNAFLLVNGEQVGQLSFITNDLVLPSEFSEDERGNDWVAFYAYKNNVVDPIILGSFAIYSYAISTEVAKIHYVYGQGVPLNSEIIDSYYGGISAEIDYSFSKYNNNKTYPLNLTWDQADLDNLVVSGTTLTTPQYSLPTFNLGTKTFLELQSDCADIQDDGEIFFSLNPNSTWNTIDSSIYFNNFAFIPSTINSIYGIFEFTDSTEQTLIYLFKDANNYFKVRRQNGNANINYVFCYNGTQTTIASYTIPSAEFVAGINIDMLLQNTTIVGLSDFFSSRSLLKMYIGNDPLSKKFTGKIYTFGIATTKNSLEISHHFNSNGLASINMYSSLLPHVASYTLLPFQEYGSYYLDISVAGYWRDYLPLSSLTSQVFDLNNNLINDLDFIQFNIDYPSPSDIPSTGQTYWTNSSLSNEYETSDNDIRSYIAFDYTTNGVAKPDSEYTNVSAKHSRIIDLNTTTWTNKRFEVVDGYLIYPDKGTSFDLISMIYFIDFKIKSVLKKQAFIRKLEFAARSLKYNQNTVIGTKYGTDITPFKKVGFYNDYKGKNPILIDKETLPYLYLTRKSGIELRNGINDTERGISIPVSSTNILSFSASAIQMFTRCDLYAFPENPVKIFEIDYADDILDFYVKAHSSDGQRGVIFAKIRSTSSEFVDLSYYLNGRLVRQPVINIQEWYVLGMSFDSALSFNQYNGKINLKYLMMFNNISVYQGTNTQILQRFTLNTWEEIENEYNWEDLDSGTWDNVLIKSSDILFVVNPQQVYRSYIGTNKVIVDDESAEFNLKTDSLRSYSDISWQNYIITPA